MRETTGQEQPKKRGRPPRDGPELRVAGVNVNPAPDAQDRLRRLFTILARVMESDAAMPEAESWQDEGREGEC